ncbi:hypothetical protein AB4Z22_10955 [Paenibacillus sp. TAF58]
MSIRDEIRKDFDGLTREEVLQKFIDLGFNVSNGSGHIELIEEIYENEFQFEMTTMYSDQEVSHKQGATFSLVLPPAC